MHSEGKNKSKLTNVRQFKRQIIRWHLSTKIHLYHTGLHSSTFVHAWLGLGSSIWDQIESYLSQFLNMNWVKQSLSLKSAFWSFSILLKENISLSLFKPSPSLRKNHLLKFTNYSNFLWIHPWYWKIQNIYSILAFNRDTNWRLHRCILFVTQKRSFYTPNNLYHKTASLCL